MGSLDGVGAEHRLALGAQPTERRLGMRARGLRGEPVERMAGGDELERTGLRESAHRRRHRTRSGRARRSCGRARRRRRSRRGRSGRRARARRRRRCRSSASRGSRATSCSSLVVRFGERRDGRVVVDEHRDSEPLPSTWRSGTSASGMLTDETTRPVSNSTTDGTPIPTASRSSVRRLSTIATS